MPWSIIVRFVALLALVMLPAATGRADDGMDHAFEIQRFGPGLRVGVPGEALTISAFDPGDPRIGMTLIAAYGPSPFLLIEGIAQDELQHRPFTIAELVVAAIGSAVSGWGLGEALDREGAVNLAIGSLSTAHALSWNLELMTNAIMRLAFGDFADTERERQVPTFLVQPFDGGAGVGLRWQS